MTNDSAEFCRRMLDEAGVAATPGTDFDPGRGARHVRFSFAGSAGDMAEGELRGGPHIQQLGTCQHIVQKLLVFPPLRQRSISEDPGGQSPHGLKSVQPA